MLRLSNSKNQASSPCPCDYHVVLPAHVSWSPHAKADGATMNASDCLSYKPALEYRSKILSPFLDAAMKGQGQGPICSSLSFARAVMQGLPPTSRACRAPDSCGGQEGLCTPRPCDAHIRKTRDRLKRNIIQAGPSQCWHPELGCSVFIRGY